MSLVAFGRKLRLAVDFLSAGRLGNVEAVEVVDGPVTPPALPNTAGTPGVCPTCGQPLPALPEESVVEPRGEEPLVAEPPAAEPPAAEPPAAELPAEPPAEPVTSEESVIDPLGEEPAVTP